MPGFLTDGQERVRRRAVPSLFSINFCMFFFCSAEKLNWIVSADAFDDSWSGVQSGISRTTAEFFVHEKKKRTLKTR